MLDSSDYYSAYGDVYSIQIESSSTLLFGSCFLAFIALFALASVIYFKQMQEATEAKSRFMMLQKIGVKDRTVKNVINKQLLFIFLPPLFIGLCHSYMILKYYILDTLTDYDLTNIVVSILAIYMIVYIVFYVTAVKVYTFIIKDRL